MSLDPFEEETGWVPLHPNDDDSHPNQDVDAAHGKGSVRHLDIDSKCIHSGNNSFKSRSRMMKCTDPQERLLAIQKKHEMKNSIRQNLVYRPLASFPKLFMKYLVLEICNCNRYIRLGKTLVSQSLHTFHESKFEIERRRGGREPEYRVLRICYL
jgi:hypothetical protein